MTPGFRLDPTQLPPPPPAVRIEHVIAAVTSLAGYKRSEIVGPRRPRELARWRMSAMFVARELTGYSLPRLGHVFRRDHTTILWAYRRVGKRMQADPVLAAEVQQVRAVALAQAWAVQ